MTVRVNGVVRSTRFDRRAGDRTATTRSRVRRSAGSRRQRLVVVLAPLPSVAVSSEVEVGRVLVVRGGEGSRRDSRSSFERVRVAIARAVLEEELSTRVTLAGRVPCCGRTQCPRRQSCLPPSRSSVRARRRDRRHRRLIGALAVENSRDVRASGFPAKSLRPGGGHPQASRCTTSPAEQVGDRVERRHEVESYETAPAPVEVPWRSSVNVLAVSVAGSIALREGRE